MIKFSVVQDVRSKVCIDLSLSIPSIWSVYLGFFRALEGIYLQPKKITRDTQIMAENILCFPVIFCNKKSHFLTRLIRTVFTIHTYLFPTSDLNELLNNMLCQNGTVRIQQPREVRVGVGSVLLACMVSKICTMFVKTYQEKRISLDYSRLC